MVIKEYPITTANNHLHNVGRHGQLSLHFAEIHGETALVRSAFRPPLQVMRAIPDQAGCLGVYVLSPTGGIVQGDRYDVDIRVDANTHALVTTIAATKVYKMPDMPAVQHVHIEVGENAILEYVPDALILFAESELHQTLTVTLHPGALLILQDVVMGGRIARNEVMKFRRFVNRIEVCDSDGLLLLDAMDYSPPKNKIDKQGLLDGYSCWGSWYLLGDMTRFDIDTSQFCQIHNELSTDKALGSISTLYRNGLGARMLSNRLEDIDKAFEKLRCEFRTLIQRPYNGLRK